MKGKTEAQERAMAARFRLGVHNPHSILDGMIPADAVMTSNQRYATLMLLAPACWNRFPKTKHIKDGGVVAYEEKYQPAVTNLCNFLMDHCTWQEVISFCRLIVRGSDFSFASFKGNEAFLKLATEYRNLLRFTG